MGKKFDTHWVWVWGWDEFFMRGWVWDSETRPRPAPLPSLLLTISLFIIPHKLIALPPPPLNPLQHQHYPI